MDDATHPAFTRIGPELVEQLSKDMNGSDLTTLLLHVAQRRAAALTPAGVLRQRERDRFVQPSAIDGRRQIEVEHRAVAALDPAFEVLTLAPLAPLGTHHAVAGVAQHRVVTTVRATEVAADPTNALALEAALRRRSLLRSDPRSSELVQLASVQRITRAQHFEGPISFSHFGPDGSGGRRTGHGEPFLREAGIDANACGDLSRCRSPRG